MDIQPFSVNDGDGIRTTIFLAGCPLKCQWCSNPEGFQQRELVGWHQRKCIGCGECVKVCPEGIGVDLNSERSRCTACGKCTEVCPVGARDFMVRIMEADDVLEQIQKHRLFYMQSGGGITFSGGEATSQPEFLKYLVDIIYDMGYSMAIETSGMFDWEEDTAEKGAAEEGTAEKGTTEEGAAEEGTAEKGTAEKGTAEKGTAEEGAAEKGTAEGGTTEESAIVSVLEKMDMIFMDLKFIDDDRHLKYTGVSNEKILKNIERLGTINDGGNSISPQNCNSISPQNWNGISPQNCNSISPQNCNSISPQSEKSSGSGVKQPPSQIVNSQPAKPQIVIRIPVIGGVNDDDDNIRRSAAFVHEKLPDARMELLPYHEFGIIKYEAMGMSYDQHGFKRPSNDRMEHLRNIAEKEGVAMADFR